MTDPARPMAVEQVDRATERLAKGQRWTAFATGTVAADWIVGIGPVTDFLGVVRAPNEQVAEWLVARLSSPDREGVEKALTEPFMTAGYAVLREAVRAGSDPAAWVKISPDEARQVRRDLQRAELARAALATHGGEAGAQEGEGFTGAKPYVEDALAGMKLWAGGDSAPADWDVDTKVAYRGGQVVEISTRTRFVWEHRGDALDIIAYTPRANPTAAGEFMGAHGTHCNRADCDTVGVCKYGDDDCPALPTAADDGRARAIETLARVTERMAPAGKYVARDILAGNLSPDNERAIAAMIEFASMRGGEVERNKIEFNRGYLIAVSNLMNLHGAEVEAQDTLDQLGCTRAEMEAMGFTDYDLEPLRRLFTESERLAALPARRTALRADAATDEVAK
jgi:hypothetical protein